MYVSNLRVSPISPHTCCYTVKLLCLSKLVLFLQISIYCNHFLSSLPIFFTSLLFSVSIQFRCSIFFFSSPIESPSNTLQYFLLRSLSNFTVLSLFPFLSCPFGSTICVDVCLSNPVFFLQHVSVCFLICPACSIPI